MVKPKVVDEIVSNNYEFFKIVREHSMSPRKYGTEDLIYTHDIDLISLIGSRDKITLTDLVKIEGKSKSSLSLIVIKLVKKGYLERRVDPLDKRRYLLELTTKGKKAYDYHEKLDDKIEEAFSEDLKGYSEEELNVFLSVQKDINNIMKKIFTDKFRESI